MAIVHGVGYPQPDRSHFASMAIWQCGSPGTPATSGWLGRWLDLAPDPVKALALDPVLPPLLAGTRTAGSTLGRTRLALPRGAAGRTVAGLALPSPSDGPWQAAAATSLADLVSATDSLERDHILAVLEFSKREYRLRGYDEAMSKAGPHYQKDPS